MDGLTATRTARHSGRNGLKTAGAAFGFGVVQGRLDGNSHVLSAIYHRSEGATVLPLVIIE
jgi:hypothetical protein